MQSEDFSAFPNNWGIEQARYFCQSLPLPLLHINEKGLIGYVNRSAAEFLHFSEEVIIGENIFHFLGEPCTESFSAALSKSLQSNQISWQGKIINGQGSLCHAEVSFLRLKTHDQFPVQLNIRSLDSTFRAEYLLKATLQNISEAVYSFDSDLMIQVFNHQALKMHSLSEPLSAVKFSDLFYKESWLRLQPMLDLSYRKIGVTISSTKEIDTHLRLMGPHGRIIPVTCNFHSFEAFGDVVTTASLLEVEKQSFSQFESEKVVPEKHKKSEKQEAQKAAAKIAFLANMSHEIRTPIASVVGYSELIQSSDDILQIKKYSEVIQRNASHLIQLIDDVLDFTKVDSGEVQIVESTFDLQEELRILINSFEPRISGKNICLRLDIEKTLPKKIITDLTRFRQVVSNLIGNSVKFTEKGIIWVNVKPSQTSEFIDIDVNDTGEGIPHEIQPRIFEIFRQGNSSFSRRHGGAGIGLALGRTIAQLLGGSLYLKSSFVDVGSCFCFSLPLKEASSNDVSSDPASETQPFVSISSDSAETSQQKLLGAIRILVVEDVDEIRELTSHYLISEGALVDLATNGLEAVEMIQSGRVYDAVLMDIQMPIMDGLEATQRLRGQGFHKPIIAVTAHTLPEEQERTLGAGCDAFIGKPFKWKNLVESVLEAIDKKARGLTKKSP